MILFLTILALLLLAVFSLGTKGVVLVVIALLLSAGIKYGN